MKLPPLILSRRESVIQWPEVNKRPYWFRCECEKKGVIKVSPYAECYSLSSFFLILCIKRKHKWSLCEGKTEIVHYIYICIYSDLNLKYSYIFQMEFPHVHILNMSLRKAWNHLFSPLLQVSSQANWAL